MDQHIAYVGQVKRGGRLDEGAAPLLCELGDQVAARLAEIDQKPS
ncbi:hypothetical protein AB0M87_06640 [Streptomyces sp. NPDC051320]